MLEEILAQRLDLTIKSLGPSTSIFALDLPLHVSGDFAELHVKPLFGSSAAQSDPTQTDFAHGLSPALERLADRNPCRH
jgi:AsmA family protein